MVGDGTGTGIRIIDRTNTTVSSCKLSGFQNGIFLQRSDFITLTDNKIGSPSRDNTSGILMLGSSNNILRGNSVANGVFGIFLEDSSNSNTVARNTATDFVNAGFLVTNSSRLNVLTENVARDSLIGFTVGPDADPADPGRGNVLTGNQAIDNGQGYVISTPDNQLTGNLVKGSFNGISVRDAAANTIEENTVVENTKLAAAPDTCGVSKLDRP